MIKRALRQNIFARSISIISQEGIAGFFRRMLRFLIERCTEAPVWMGKWWVIRSFRKFSSSDPSTTYHYIRSVFLHLFAPMQVTSEFLKLLTLFKDKSPKVIVEIGTAMGGALFCFTKLASPNSRIVGIDIGGYRTWKVPIYQAFARETQNLHLLRFDSHHPETLQKLREILQGEPINFLFIDGDHSFEGVKRDFEMYAPLVAKGGIIAFHDIVPGPRKNVGGVPEFWKELKTRFPHEEFVENWNQGGMGIGVIFV